MPGPVLTAFIGTNEVHGPIHEFGGTIRPKSAPYLVFEWEEMGVLIRTTKVTIPARPYLRPAIDIHKAAAIAAIGTTFRKLVLPWGSR